MLRNTSSGGGGAGQSPRRWFQTPQSGVSSASSPSSLDLLADLRLDPEEALEVDETSDLDAAAEDRAMPHAFSEPRHALARVASPPAAAAAAEAPGDDALPPAEAGNWRMRERMKTVSVALVVCLNVGVDPPDVTKTSPCARQECWIDPTALNPQRAIEAIGNSLQKQYERWQPRARYRQSLDPPLEEVRRLATALRRNARDERVLFHYNGHGVPKPTANGEIWVFNRNYTQYIPLSLYDLQSWMGSPSIFVYDCSNAGIIVQAFDQFAAQHEREFAERMKLQQAQQQQQQAQQQQQLQLKHQQSNSSAGAADSDATSAANGSNVTISDVADQSGSGSKQPPISAKNCIQLAACGANEMLPMNPELPADLFSSCLTTPVKMALRYFVLQKHGKLARNVTLEMLDKIPGAFGDRRTMLGELNWIFTAITDTIAWNTLSRDMFQKLFRQDLLVASLYRNFLLAERVMRSYDCTPQAQPAMPSTAQHPMWQAWDLSVDVCLEQLPRHMEPYKAPYKPSVFFENQLTAFEVWLKFGKEDRRPPEQLPIVLQVLLSQAHRLRALDLLGHFLDLGPWAVHMSLCVGIFPYVLKLLQSQARELKPLLVSIWGKILAVDPSCQADLLRENGHVYFLNVLQDEATPSSLRAWATFNLANMVGTDFAHGQKEAEQQNLIPTCLEHMDEEGEPLLRQWLALALGRVWDGYEKARWRGARDNAHETLYKLLADRTPEVRAAAVYALGTFVSSCRERTEHSDSMDQNIAQNLLNSVGDDGSPLVRKELVVAFSHVVYAFEAKFVTVCRVAMEEQPAAASSSAMTAMTASMTSSLKRVSSRDRVNNLTPSVSSPSLDRLAGGAAGGAGAPTMQRSGSSFLAGASSLSSLAASSVFTRVWTSMNQLALDPQHDIASMAESLLLYLKIKARERIASRHIPSIVESASVPSSPARPSFLLGASPPSAQEADPPAAQQQQQPQQPAPPPSRAASVTHQQSTGSNNSNSHASPGTSQTPSPNSTQTARDIRAPKFSTDFFVWSARNFTRLARQRAEDSSQEDRESTQYHQLEYLFERNLEVRGLADRQRDLLRARQCRLDEQTASFRTSFTPSLVCFHPYNPQVTLGGQKQIVIRDLDTGINVCSIAVREKRYARSQFTALGYLNAHEHALLLAGTDDGCLRVYRDESDMAADGTRRIHQISSWHAMPELVPAAGRTHPRRAASATQHVGLKASWEQKSSRVAVGGDSRLIRLWDCAAERRAQDLPTASDSFVSCLNFSPGSPDVFVAGFGDGSLRLYDARAREHVVGCTGGSGRAVLDCQLQDSGGFVGHVVSGSNDGEIRVVDPRKFAKDASAVVRRLQLGAGQQAMSSLAVHKRAFAAAAWPEGSHSVSTHSLLAQSGPASQLNLLRPSDSGVGILAHRFGPASTGGCLAFHPHLIQLAVGSADGHVNIFNLKKTY